MVVFWRELQNEIIDMRESRHRYMTTLIGRDLIHKTKIKIYVLNLNKTT